MMYTSNTVWSVIEYLCNGMHALFFKSRPHATPSYLMLLAEKQEGLMMHVTTRYGRSKLNSCIHNRTHNCTTSRLTLESNLVCPHHVVTCKRPSHFSVARLKVGCGLGTRLLFSMSVYTTLLAACLATLLFGAIICIHLCYVQN